MILDPQSKALHDELRYYEFLVKLQNSPTCCSLVRSALKRGFDKIIFFTNDGDVTIPLVFCPYCGKRVKTFE